VAFVSRSRFAAALNRTICSLAVLSIASSCGTYLPTSLPTVAESSSWSTTGNTVNGPGVKIHLVPSTDPSPFIRSLYSSSTFTITFVVNADSISSYTLDPSQVKLIVSDTPPLSATIYPTLPATDHIWRASDQEMKTPTRLSETNKSFELRFNVAPPSPDTEFTLLIDGLTRTDVPLTFPPIVFKKGVRYVGGSFRG
jgi:hypothetical protein